MQVYEFQRELVYKLASECARGVPGSAIFLSHGSQYSGDHNGSDASSGVMTRVVSRESEGSRNSRGGPLVYYIKVGAQCC